MIEYNGQVLQRDVDTITDDTPRVNIMLELNGTNISTAFQGCELTQVCFGKWQTVLNFTGDLRISLECDYQVNGSQNDPHGLINILDSKIVSASLEDDGEVAILFESGNKVAFGAGRAGQESYQILINDKILIK